MIPTLKHELHATLSTTTGRKPLVEQQFDGARKLNAIIIHTRGMQFKLPCASLSTTAHRRMDEWNYSSMHS
jgi:hypothetical protein